LDPKPGESAIIQQHFELLLPKEEERNWVLNYLAV
jgi:hypothetical protein